MALHQIDLELAGVRGTVHVDGHDLRAQRIEYVCDVRSGESSIRIDMPVPSVMAKLSDVDVVALFGGLNPEEMLLQVERALYGGGHTTRPGMDADERWRVAMERLQLRRPTNMGQDGTNVRERK